MTGGTKNLSYMASLGYVDQNSLFKGPDYGYKRYNGRLNLSHKFNERLTVSATAQYTRNVIKDHAYWTEWIIEQCNRMPAIYEIKNADGTYNYPSGSNSNSLERLEAGGYRLSRNEDISGTLTADFKIIDGLTASAQYWPPRPETRRTTFPSLPTGPPSSRPRSPSTTARPSGRSTTLPPSLVSPTKGNRPRALTPSA